MRCAFPLLAVCLMAAPVGLAAPGAAGFGFSATGCTDAGFLVPVDAARVRPYVPADIALLGEASGKALVSVGFQACDALTLDGLTAPSRGSVALAFIEPPGGGPGAGDTYVLWFLTDRADLQSKLTGAGFGGSEVARYLSFQSSGLAPGVRTASGGAVSSHGSYAISRCALVGDGPVGPPGITMWREDAGVLHRLDFAFTIAHGGAGAAILTAGGPVGDLIGQGFVEAPALWYDNAYAATVT